MIKTEEIEKQLKSIKDVDHVKFEGDGYHFHLTIVGDLFVGKTKVQRQQLIYKELNSYITSGELHALSMKTLTKEEWEKQNG